MLHKFKMILTNTLAFIMVLSIISFTGCSKSGNLVGDWICVDTNQFGKSASFFSDNTASISWLDNSEQTYEIVDGSNLRIKYAKDSVKVYKMQVDNDKMILSSSGESIKLIKSDMLRDESEYQISIEHSYNNSNNIRNEYGVDDLCSIAVTVISLNQYGDISEKEYRAEFDYKGDTKTFKFHANYAKIVLSRFFDVEYENVDASITIYKNGEKIGEIIPDQLTIIKDDNYSVCG